MQIIAKLQNVSDQALVAKLLELACVERQSHVDLLVYLGELDARKLFLELGYSSMWDYCRRALQFSESVSQQRIVVARAARRNAVILEMIGASALTLCTAADLAPALTDENHAELLARAAGKSRREVQDMKGGTKAVERDVIRRLEPQGQTEVTRAIFKETDETKIDEPNKSGEPAEVSSPARHRVAFTASASVVEKLERLQSLLGDAGLEDVIDRAADRLLDEVDPVRREGRREARQMKRAAAEPKKHRTPKKDRATEPRRPPVALRDRVMAASSRRCEFVSAEGVRCAETRFLSVDHIRPYALGGSSTDVRNLRCLCMAHNVHLGRKTFGSRAL